MEDKIKQLVTQSRHIVVVQADNPDADSLGSALALEQILANLGKTVTLYCGVDIPSYLRYMSGWDRVVNDLPKQFDLSIIVDASTYTLLEQLSKTRQISWLKTKPAVVLDHHTSVEKAVDFADVMLAESTASSTGELIFDLSQQLGWEVDVVAGEHVMSAILGDTQGLTNSMTSANTYRVMAQLIELGVNRPRLEELRRETSKMPASIYRYKAELIKRTNFTDDGIIAYLTIPQDEINTYSPSYNPAVLVQFDSLQVVGVQVSIVFKTYDDGHLTAKIRCNPGAPIAAKLAEQMGGGGHTYASGFKIEKGKPFDEIRTTCLATASKLITEINQQTAV